MLESAAAPILDERKFYREWWFISVLAMGALVLMTTLKWGQSPGQLIYDQFHRWQSVQADPQIVVVAIDNTTLDALGGWPLNRRHYAQLLSLLAHPSHQPRVIGLDLLLLDPSPADELLAAQMRKHRVVLVAEQGRHPAEPSQRLPVSTLRQASSALAHINISFESDGAMRGVHLREGMFEHLALVLSGHEPERYSSQGSYRRFIQINPLTGLPTVSLSDVLSGQLPLSLFKDKYVLIGATSPSLGDQLPGVFAGQHNAGTPGVVMHASVLSGLLQGQLITSVPNALQHGLSAMALATVLLALLLFSPRVELTVSLATIGIVLVLSWALLRYHHQWFDPGLPIMAIALVKPAWAWRRSEMVLYFLRQGVNSLGHPGQHLRASKSTDSAEHSRWFLRSNTIQQNARLLKNAMRRTQSQLQFLNRLVSEVPSALLAADSQGLITLVNPRLLESLPAGLLQKGEPVMPLLFYLGLSKNLQLQQLTGKDQYVSAIDNQGRLRHYIFHLAEVEGDDAQPWWILVLTDITEMRQLQLSRDKTLQLLSHDMRTPVASILALTRQNPSVLPSPEPEQWQLSAPGRIEHHANTLLHMMDDFIFSVKAEAPEYALVESLVDSLVDEAVYQVKDLALGRQMSVVVKFQDEPQFILAEPRLLTRMLVNLLVNAVRYGQPHTEIVLKLSHQSAGAPDTGGWLHISLSNTVGLHDKSGQQHPAFMNGFGLGLEFVKNVVRKHAGQIDFDLPTQPGSKAHVRLKLPLVDWR